LGGLGDFSGEAKSTKVPRGDGTCLFVTEQKSSNNDPPTWCFVQMHSYQWEEEVKGQVTAQDNEHTKASDPESFL